MLRNVWEEEMNDQARQELKDRWDCHPICSENWLMAWHLRWSGRQTRVSKEQVRNVLAKYHAYYKGSSTYFDSNLINELSDLYPYVYENSKDPEKEKEWCSHWKINKSTQSFSWNGENHFWADDFDICPVKGCHAPRPGSEA